MAANLSLPKLPRPDFSLRPHRTIIGNGWARSMSTKVRRLCGQRSTGPSGVRDHVPDVRAVNEMDRHSGAVREDSRAAMAGQKEVPPP